MPRRRPAWPQLKERLDVLAATFGPEHLSPDPLEVVLRYASRGGASWDGASRAESSEAGCSRDDSSQVDGSRDDVEVVGFLAAALAFGSARGAVKSVEALLARIAPSDGVGGVASASPAAAVRAWDAARDVAKLRGWRHRWLGERDAAAALHVLGRMLREHGSIEAFFAAGDEGAPRAAGDARTHAEGAAASEGAVLRGHDADVGAALASFCDRALALAPPRAPKRLAYWFSGPGKGGSAKRLCLFLRWMCRKDGLDPGPWTSVDPSRLVVPLDTHVARISRYTGLLRRRSANWLAAQEVTANLRRFDAADPVGSVANPLRSQDERDGS